MKLYHKHFDKQWYMYYMTMLKQVLGCLAMSATLAYGVGEQQAKQVHQRGNWGY